jgi:hypothetical protein
MMDNLYFYSNEEYYVGTISAQRSISCRLHSLFVVRGSNIIRRLERVDEPWMQLRQ